MGSKDFVLCVLFFTNLISCDFPFSTRSDLASTSPASPNTPDCSACHNYPLQDGNHHLHLLEEGGNRMLNGRITCADCHNTSVPSIPVMVLDTLFEDPATGTSYYSSEPHASISNGAWKMISIDTLIQNHPITAHREKGPTPKILEWVTGIAHMNGTIDVVFDDRNSDTVRFHGERAHFNPARETCSAVACHPGYFPYRFAAPAKGLSFLGGNKPDSL